MLRSDVILADSENPAGTIGRAGFSGIDCLVPTAGRAHYGRAMVAAARLVSCWLSGGPDTGIPKRVRAVIPWPWRWDLYVCVGGSSMLVSHPPHLWWHRRGYADRRLALRLWPWILRSDIGNVDCPGSTLSWRAAVFCRQDETSSAPSSSCYQRLNITISRRSIQALVVLNFWFLFAYSKKGGAEARWPAAFRRRAYSRIVVLLLGDTSPTELGRVLGLDR